MLILASLIYLLFAVCIIYPPTEFISAGFTIPQLFTNIVGSESSNFIQHHIKRTALSLFIHSLLLLGYVLTLFANGWDPSGSFVSALLTTSSLAFPLYIIFLINSWHHDNWDSHPIVLSLKEFLEAGEQSWQIVALRIDSDFRNNNGIANKGILMLPAEYLSFIEKVQLQMNGISKVVVTNNWIIKTLLYNVHFAKQSEATLVVKNTDTHNLSSSGATETQYINIEVQPGRLNLKSFNIRINSLDFKELQEKVTRPIIVLPNITFHTSILDQFLMVFKQSVELNAKFYSDQVVMELCIGCMQARANIKLQKQCVDTEETERPCGSCNCRPMWCVDCMGRWFASRQDQDHTETWLSNKCTCPVCRTVFCMLDISYVESR